MHISLGGVFNICENGGPYVPPEKLLRILCNSIKCLLLHNYTADSAIILYLEFLEGLISHFQKLGQRDLNKENYIKICKKTYFKLLLINHQADFNEI